MPYQLHLKMLRRTTPAPDAFDSVSDAVTAAVQIKAACTEPERRELAMFVTDDEGIMKATDTEIDKAYRAYVERA